MKWFSYKGACTAKDQIEMVEAFCQRRGKEKIQAVLGDREFDNEALIKHLEKEGIPYVIRIRKSAYSRSLHTFQRLIESLIL